MVKECAEEAQIPPELIEGKLRPVGAIRYVIIFVGHDTISPDDEDNRESIG